jgi:hypothetical protein
MARLRPRIADARRLANPRTAAAQVRDNPAPTVILLVLALAAVQTYKAGQLPSVQTAGALLVGALALVAAANFAPSLVTYSLLLMLLYVGLTNQPVIEDLLRGVTSKVNLGPAPIAI